GSTPRPATSSTRPGASEPWCRAIGSSHPTKRSTPPPGTMPRRSSLGAGPRRRPPSGWGWTCPRCTAGARNGSYLMRWIALAAVLAAARADAATLYFQNPSWDDAGSCQAGPSPCTDLGQAILHGQRLGAPTASVLAVKLETGAGMSDS